MPFNMVPLTWQRTQPEVSYGNLEQLVRGLRGMTKDSVVEGGSQILWRMFQSDMGTTRPLNTAGADAFIVKAYGGRVLMLALATCSNFRGEPMTTPSGFPRKCAEFMALPTPMSSQEFLAREAEEIAAGLLADGKIPNQYISVEEIRGLAGIFMVSRHVGLQHQHTGEHLDELHRDYDILKRMNAAGGNVVEEALAATCQMSSLQMIRATMSMFGLAALAGNDGKLNFDRIGVEADLATAFDIDITTCRRVVDALCVKESRLLDNWYREQVLTEETLYQPYVPDPLLGHPFVHRDTSINQNQYLIPSPYGFVRGFRHGVFSKIYAGVSSRRRGEIGNLIGHAVMGHIETALRQMFGTDNVIPLEADDTHADYHVRLPNVDLIIEIKTNIGDFADKAIMSPRHIPKLWGQWYKACSQCGGSIRQMPPSDRLRVAMVLVANDFVAQPLPFQAYANQMGIFRDLGIGAIEFVTWSKLETTLGQTSVAKFEEALIEKWQSAAPFAEGIMTTQGFERDEPAHNFEYLQEAEAEIYAGIGPR